MKRIEASLLALIMALFLISCSTTKQVVSKMETTQTIIEQTVDTTVTVTLPPIVASTSKDSLISAIAKDSTYHLADGSNVIEVSTKAGKVTVKVIPKPVEVKVQIHKRTTTNSKVVSKAKDVKRTNYIPIFVILIVCLALSVLIAIFVRRFRP